MNRMYLSLKVYHRMRSMLLPVTNTDIAILDYSQFASQADDYPRSESARQLCKRLVNVLLAIITGSLLVAFLVRYLQEDYPINIAHDFPGIHSLTKPVTETVAN